MSLKLIKSTAVVSVMTFLSRIMGLIRDVVMARFFGAGAGTDAFLVAFKIPNFFRRLFAEASFAYAFVPVLSEYKTQRTHEEVQAFVDRVAGSLASVLFLLTLVGVIFAPIFIMIFAPTWMSEQPYKHELASAMLVLTFPYVLFISLTAFAGGILNAYGKFAIPAFTPVLLNVSLIVCAVWLSPYLDQPIMALGWGVFLAGVSQLLFQIPYLMKIGLLPKPKWGWKDQGVRRVLRLMGPTLLSSSVMQISLLIDIWLASALITGSVSWLYYSDRLVEFPLGVFGIALATVVLPALSRSYAEKSHEKFNMTLDWSLRWVMIISIPSTVGLMVLAGPLIATVFYGNEFTAEHVVMTTWALMAYSIGLLGFILVKVLAPGFYSRQDTKTPMLVAVRSLYSKVILSFIFLWFLVDWNFMAAHVGLALATALGSLINAGYLYWSLRKQNIYTPGTGWFADISRIVFAGLTMGGILYWLSPEMQQWLDWSVWMRILNVAKLVGIGIAAFFIAVLATGLKPWRWKSEMS